MSVPVGSLKKASVRLDWFSVSTSSGSGRTTALLQAANLSPTVTRSPSEGKSIEAYMVGS